MEAAELACFMFVAGLVTVAVQYPGSPVRQLLPCDLVRRIVIGAAMGLTAAAIIYSPPGRRSGAHFNPAVTLAFFRLGKVEPWDALFYVVAQFLGGIGGVAAAAGLAPRAVPSPQVNYIITVPGPAGTGAAFGAELAMSFLLMLTVLVVTNTQRIAHLAGAFAGLLVAFFIIIGAPVSGMSINPARTIGSAVPAGDYQAMWVYLVAPVVGMLLATETYLHGRTRRTVRSAKLHHDRRTRCIFHCDHHWGRPKPAGTEGLLDA
jgi:aquaporin Z